MSYLVSFSSCIYNPFSIAITSIGEERADLSAFRTFVRFVLVWICRFSLPLRVWEGLRFVIVALPGLFSYLFLQRTSSNYVLLSKSVFMLALVSSSSMTDHFAFCVLSVSIVFMFGIEFGDKGDI